MDLLEKVRQIIIADHVGEGDEATAYALEVVLPRLPDFRDLPLTDLRQLTDYYDQRSTKLEERLMAEIVGKDQDHIATTVHYLSLAREALKMD